MSKTITIPSDRGSRVIVEINGVQYIYAAGSTVTVPDAVAACIADSVAMKPGGYRESKFDEAHESLEARVEALEAGGGGGAGLPEVSATDNGDVLTVVEGAWAKAAPSGGGALIVEMDLDEQLCYTSRSTWQEIADALSSGTPVFAKCHIQDETSSSYGLAPMFCAFADSGQYNVMCIDAIASVPTLTTLSTDSPSGYPTNSEPGPD